MDRSTTSSDYVETRRETGNVPAVEGYSSGVSWGAVIGGAFVMAALYLILLALGAGLGLSVVSPWPGAGASASAVGAGAIVWLIVMAIVASALGGYMTGRLRTKWARIHNDEVFFRDTANGFLAWAVALVASVTFLASAAAFIPAGVSPVAAGEVAASASGTPASTAYFVDALFRSERTGPENGDTAAQEEAAAILTNGLRQEQMPPADQAYLARLVAARTGTNVADAERRVTDVLIQARQAADTARKETAHLLLWLFLSSLIGAFVASYFATIGGRLRDHVKPV